MNVYSHANWVIFREEVVKLDGGKCVQCGRSREDGVILQVHHKQYIPGHLPWEYAHSDCETLCKGCHAREHGVIMPQAEWRLVGSDDLGEFGGYCEACGTQLRYIYAIVHPKWGSLAVGTDCCDRLTLTKEASEYHEQTIKVREARSRFLSSPRWKDRSGGWEIKQKGIRFRISPSKRFFCITMNGIYGRAEYPTLVDAKLKIFDLVASGEARAFLEKRASKANKRFQK